MICTRSMSERLQKLIGQIDKSIIQGQLFLLESFLDINIRCMAPKEQERWGSFAAWKIDLKSTVQNMQIKWK